jgi:hypothetical protein
MLLMETLFILGNCTLGQTSDPLPRKPHGPRAEVAAKPQSQTTQVYISCTPARYCSSGQFLMSRIVDWPARILFLPGQL